MEPAPEIKPARARAKRAPKKQIEFLSQQEIEMFFRVIRDPRDRALFRLIYHRGLRASEPGKLQLADYRPGPGRPKLYIRRLKGSISGEHTLVDLEVQALRAWLRVRGPAPGPLFRSRKHAPLGRKQVYRLMRRYSLLAGIAPAKAHPHALKHSCATHIAPLLAGNVVEMQDHLGHADVRNTMRYLRSTERETRGDRLADWGKRI